MKKILFWWILFIGVFSVNAQTDFATIGAKWYYNCCAGGNIANSHLNNVVSEEDIIIDKKNCRVLRQYRNNSNTISAEYIIKQEQGKVYYYHQNQFNLLFDFDVAINDIVEFTFVYKKYGDDFPLYKETILSARYQVENITTNAQNLKTFTTKILEEDKFAEYGMEILPWHYSYTEKIGFYYEFMPILDNLAQYAVDNFRMLRCYSDTDLSFVSDEWSATSLPCNYSTAASINTLKDKEDITIFPNPFNENIFVSSNNEGYISIMDITGKIIYNSKLSDGINEISTSHFLKGIYFVKIQNKNNSIQTFKTVKI